MSISPVRLNHAVLFVADLDRSLRFYTDKVGLEVRQDVTVPEIIALLQEHMAEMRSVSPPIADCCE